MSSVPVESLMMKARVAGSPQIRRARTLVATSRGARTSRSPLEMLASE
jgi:hypothetical protein